MTSWLRGGRCGFLFIRASARQNVSHGVIAFVTSVLKDSVGALRHGDLDGPGLGVNGGIIDGGLVDDGVRIYPAEALDDVEILVGHSIQVADSETALVVKSEIGGVDNQSVAFPVAARIARPLADLWW